MPNFIDNLVSVDKFNTRSSAVKWLVTEGIKANRTYLDKVADAISQIGQLKKEVVDTILSKDKSQN